MTMTDRRLQVQSSPEGSSTKKLESDDPCEICKVEKAKYNCPGCYTRTCSLPCVQTHKTRFGCDGVAKRTKMVTMEQFDALTLLNDYRFLEEAKRVAAKTTGLLDGCKDVKRDLKRLKILITECRRRGIRLEMSPVGMEKSLTNTSSYNNVAETLFWRIEWIFVDAENFTIETDKNPESVKLDTLLRQFIKARHGCEMIIPNFTEDNRFSKYRLPPNVSEVPWNCYLKCERNGWTKDTRYYKLDNMKTICENLKGKVLIEYPTIYVTSAKANPMGDPRFPLLTEDTQRSLLQKRIWERKPVSRTLADQMKLMDFVQLPAVQPIRNDQVSKPKPMENANATSSERPQEPAPMRPLRRLLRPPPSYQYHGPPGSQDHAHQKKPHWNPFAAKRVGKRQAIDDLAVALSIEKEEEEKSIDRRYPDVYVEEKKPKKEKEKKNDYFSLLGFNYASSGDDDDSDLEEGEIR